MNKSAEIGAGIVAGVVAGAVASFVMDGFQRLWGHAEVAIDPSLLDEKKGEPSTVKAADLGVKTVTSHPVPARYRPLSGDLTHYALGCAVGAVYGAANEVSPAFAAGNGAVYGTLLWLALDESMLPALGIAKPWAKVPLKTHAFAFVSHLVFGVTLEATRAAVRSRLSRSDD